MDCWQQKNEIVFLLSLVLWMYLEFFSSTGYLYINYLSLVIAFYAFLVMRSRYVNYVGFYDGCYQGFKDAAVRNLDYWGNSHTERSDEKAITSTLTDIENIEEGLTVENRNARDA